MKRPTNAAVGDNHDMDSFVSGHVRKPALLLYALAQAMVQDRLVHSHADADRSDIPDSFKLTLRRGFSFGRAHSRDAL